MPEDSVKCLGEGGITLVESQQRVHLVGETLARSPCYVKLRRQRGSDNSRKSMLWDREEDFEDSWANRCLAE